MGIKEEIKELKKENEKLKNDWEEAKKKGLDLLNLRNIRINELEKENEKLKEQCVALKIIADTYYDWIAQWDGYSEPEDIKNELWTARNGYNTNHIQVHYHSYELTEEYKKSIDYQTQLEDNSDMRLI